MPLTENEKKQLKHIYDSERERGLSKEKSKKIAEAFVYARKRRMERM